MGDTGVVLETATCLSSWANLIQERFVALRITPGRPAGLGGVIRTRHVGPLQVATVESTAQTFDRTRSQAARADTELLAVGLVEAGTGYLVQDGRTCEVRTGAFAVYDTTRPFTWAFRGDWKLGVYTWPRTRIASTEAEISGLTAVSVPRETGIGAVVAPVLRQLAGDAMPDLSPTGGARLAAEIADLAVLAASEAGRQADPSSHDDALLRRATAFIEQNLADPDLGPGRIAAEFYVSTRTLSRVFGRQGLSVAAWVKRRRLEMCRQLLCSAAADHLQIQQVAARHGFVNASFFSREFTARFGESPRRWRERHRAGR